MSTQATFKLEYALTGRARRFVDSEFALIEALHALLLLSSQPTMAFPLLLELSTHNSIADLLSHENTDVVVAVIEVLEEWTDEEVLEADEDEEDDATDARRDAMKALVEGLVEAGIVELAVSGIERFNEDDETERGGLFHSLGKADHQTLYNHFRTDPCTAQA